MNLSMAYTKKIEEAKSEGKLEGKLEAAIGFLREGVYLLKWFPASWDSRSSPSKTFVLAFEPDRPILC